MVDLNAIVAVAATTIYANNRHHAEHSQTAAMRELNIAKIRSGLWHKRKPSKNIHHAVHHGLIK